MDFHANDTTTSSGIWNFKVPSFGAFCLVGRNKNHNAKPPATFSTQRNLSGGTRGLPRVKTQRNILHQDHVAPVGVSRTPGWDSVKKPCENPGVVELVKHVAGGVPTIDINWLDEMARVLYGFWAGEVEEVEDLEDEEFHVEEGYDSINF